MIQPPAFGAPPAGVSPLPYKTLGVCESRLQRTLPLPAETAGSIRVGFVHRSRRLDACCEQRLHSVHAAGMMHACRLHAGCIQLLWRLHATCMPQLQQTYSSCASVTIKHRFRY